MSGMLKRIDILAEIHACERILAFDDTRLNLELRKEGVRPEGLLERLQGDATIQPDGHASDGRAPVVQASAPQSPAQSSQADGARERQQQAATSLSTTPAVPPPISTFEVAGEVKFFDAGKGYGFITTDCGDVLVHIIHLREAGYQTVYENARIHALARQTDKGLQVQRILHLDQTSARHPSLQPQRTHQKVQAESDWVRAIVKWYNFHKGYGFLTEGEGHPDCMVHAITLQCWGVAPLAPKQVVEIRWGNTPKGRMVAEIRYIEGLSALPPVH